MKPLFTILAVAALLGSLFPRSAPAANTVLLATVTGTIINYTAGNTTLNVNTPIGPRSFLVSTNTLILVNNHTGTTTNLTAGLKARVTFNYQTATATLIHVTNHNTLTAKVNTVTGAVGANTIGVKVSGATVSLKTDANSDIQLNGIPVTDPKVLVGVKMHAVFEPSTFLILNADATASVVQGTIAAIDTTKKTITVGTRTFTLDPNATIRRDKVTATLATLAVGDTVRVSFIKDNATTFRALAVDATAPAS